jgi:hypothetical protein
MQKMFDAKEHCGYRHEKSSDGYQRGHAPPMRSRINKSAAALSSVSQPDRPKESIAGVRNDIGYVDQQYE